MREALARIQRHTMARAAELFDTFAAPGRDREQLAFEFRAICLAYHHAARMLREPRAGERARTALESLIEKALS